MPLSAVSPRVFQLYSPRRPSPLGLPPLAPHGSHHQDIQCNSAYPKTPERYYYQHYYSSSSASAEPITSGGGGGGIHHGMRFPPDVHRRTSTNGNQRARALPPAPLSLDSQYHPAAAIVHLPSIEETLSQSQQQPPSQSLDTQEREMKDAPPFSPTPSSTSSLSLYSTESAKKTLEIGEEGEGVDKKNNGGGGGFCLCFNFSSLFGSKAKQNKILGPQPQPQPQPQVLAAEPTPAPLMVQPRRRPPSLVLVR